MELFRKISENTFGKQKIFPLVPALQTGFPAVECLIGNSVFDDQLRIFRRFGWLYDGRVEFLCACRNYSICLLRDGAPEEKRNARLDDSGFLKCNFSDGVSEIFLVLH